MHHASSGRAAVSLAVALVDHVGQAFEELSFKRGDTIRDIEPAEAIPASPASPLASLSASTEGGVFIGTLRGRKGYFRGKHVVFGALGAPAAVASSSPAVGGGPLDGKGAADLPLQPLELLNKLREAEELLQAREIQVAALKAMKKREEQTKLIESRARDTLSRHLDAWRRVVVDARAARALEHKDAQIERLAQRVRDMGGRVTPRYS